MDYSDAWDKLCRHQHRWRVAHKIIFRGSRFIEEADKILYTINHNTHFIYTDQNNHWPKATASGVVLYNVYETMRLRGLAYWRSGFKSMEREEANIKKIRLQLAKERQKEKVI